MKKYEYAVVIGRFQPMHLGHLGLFTHAASLADNLIVIIGSDQTTPDPKNPFSTKLRKEMLESALEGYVMPENLYIDSVRDYPYNGNVWLTEVQNKVKKIANGSSKIALVGLYKDATSAYLNEFPQWSREVSQFAKLTMNATDLRNDMFSDGDSWRENVLESAIKPISDFMQTSLFADLKSEHQFLTKYKADMTFKGAPNIPPMYLTTDAVIVQSGHILLVKRGYNPGKGRYGLPGGFLEQDLSLEDNMLKEVAEETNIKVPKNILRANITSKEIFDHPDRSLRGRTVTTAFLINLPAHKDGLPSVCAGSDASEAAWHPISSIFSLEDKMFEDHGHIIKHFLGI